MEVVSSFECIKKFGEPKEKATYLKTVVTPDKIKNGIPAFKKYTKLTMHQAILTPFLTACEYLVDNNLASYFVEYGGSFNIRKNVNNRNVWSIHSWALAFDMNMSTNPNGKTAHLDSRVVAVFKDNGFDWGGDFHTVDGQHFQISKKLFNLI